ncbi:general amidase [Lentinus tigrinus ALCF2SS1-7]|uniref:general amidase n=1 Tax=Lentinus tigrinus ALCF2SS1-7 TaxID=1328758 RepID=UPI00116605BF|nr:general amidase [Lentinus tigrinus ALCF2SS1-7]
MTANTWQELVADKRRRQQAAIPPEWMLQSPPDQSVLDVRGIPEQSGILSQQELEITNTTDVDVLLHKLATAQWSSVEVTTAFYKRAIIAHQLVNCLTEIFVERALRRARELDEHLQKTGKVVGPLHGLPISLKDQICNKGLEATMGYATWIGKYSKEDAVIVQVLYAAGAVPFVMTNVPQTLLWSETYNLVYGRTLNPANRTLGAGGSSGGEGALVAMRGSPIGIGSDIGGSVRYPSTFNGLYGLRPSASRVPYSGCVNSTEGQDSAPSVLGPISGSISGVKAFMKAVIAQQPWLLDPLCIRKKWDEEAYALSEHGGGKQLCFGIIWDDGMVVPHPPILRALRVTKAALEAAGHTVIDWHPLKHKELFDVLADIWMSAALEDINTVLAETGEPRLTSMALENNAAVETGVPYSEGISAYQLWQLHKKRIALREEYLAAWRASASTTGTGRPVDAIIGPVAPYAAPPHGKATIAAYTMAWNTLNYPCCAFPVTTVDPVQDVVQPRDTFLGDHDKQNYAIYNPETFRNAPVGLQLAAQTLEDEAVIAMTEIVDQCLRDYKAAHGIV